MDPHDNFDSSASIAHNTALPANAGAPPAGRYLLVMTASIVPNQIPGLTRTEPALRAADYAGSLQSYWKTSCPPVGGLLFLENSGADLSPLKDIVRAAGPNRWEIEFVSLDENNFDPQRGKGYGEYRMLDAGLGRSQLADRFDYWVKVTGRYFVSNLRSILTGLPESFALACDLKDHWLRGRRYRSFDTSLTVYHRDFYNEYVQGVYEQVYEIDYSPDWLENVLYRLACDALARGDRVVPRFPRTPRILGQAGHHGKNFHSPSMRLKWHFKSLLRRTAPWLWI